MSSIKLGHVAYVVTDMEKAQGFYEGILGFRRIFDVNDADGNPWIVYFKVADGEFIELFYRKNEADKPESPSVGYSHLCLIVDDLKEFVRTIEGRGGELEKPIKVGGDGNWQGWVHDPDGNRIELMQISKDSPQAKHGAV